MSNFEDILSESLELLGGKPVIDDSFIRYGPLVLTLAPKEGKANTLLADHLFSPALFLSERIERGLLASRGKAVIELGAGSALPSLLLSTREDAPSLIVITDYPDDGILGNLKKNIERNSDLVNRSCTVKYRGYEWGRDASSLLGLLEIEGKSGYDVVILSDLLHFLDSHDVLISSIQSLMATNKDSRAYIGAGKYTHVDVCENFLRKASAAGFEIVEIHDDLEEQKWLGTLPVNTLDTEALILRKYNCRYWVCSWRNVQ